MGIGECILNKVFPVFKIHFFRIRIIIHLDSGKADGNDFDVLRVAAEDEGLDEVGRGVGHRLDHVRRSGFRRDRPQAEDARLRRFLGWRED